MSQRDKKYARNIERRTGTLEEIVERQQERINMLERNQVEQCAGRIIDTIYNDSVERKTEAKIRRQRRETERDLERQRRGVVLAMLLAVIALIVAVKATDAERAPEMVQPTASMDEKVEADLLTTELVEVIGPWEFAALYRAAESPAEKQRIGEVLEAQGYFSAVVPLPWEYQDYMRTYCHLYGCPYPLALAVADWETRGQFNMDAIGPAGEVGIFQLNPGSGGTYHAELEAATGLDPTTPEGNIAGGCYLLGKYLVKYEDITMAAMAYNMGQDGAGKARGAGTTSTEYTDAVLEAIERWECVVSTWAGE